MSWIRVEMEIEGVNSIAKAEDLIRDKVETAKHVRVFAIAVKKEDFC